MIKIHYDTDLVLDDYVKEIGSGSSILLTKFDVQGLRPNMIEICGAYHIWH